MNQINPVLADAKGYGYTGKVPDGATGVKKGANGEIIFLFGDGKPSQSYNADGSVFTQKPAVDDTTPPAKVETPTTDDNAGRSNVQNGNGNGSSGSIFGTGFGGAGFGGGFDFGMGQNYLDAGMEVDPNKFNNAVFSLSSIINMGTFLPFGLGDFFAQGGIMAAMQNFMDAVTFNFKAGGTSTEISTRDETPDGTTVVSGGGDGNVTPEENVPAGAGVSPDANNPQVAPEENPQVAPEAGVAPKKKVTKKQKVTPKKEEEKPKTEADLAKEGGYVKLTSGYYRKNGQIYKFKDGKFTYFADNIYTDGRYVKDGKVYNKNGTDSKTTIAAGNAPVMFTLEHFKNDGNNYEMSHYNGRTILKTKDGNPEVTRYFDASGRLVQTNSFDKGGFFREPVNGVSRYEYNSRGVITKREDTNILKNRTITTEYNLTGLKPGKTTTTGPVQTEQRMDSQGRTSTFKYQATTTVEVVSYKGKFKRITTVVKNQVR